MARKAAEAFLSLGSASAADRIPERVRAQLEGLGMAPDHAWGRARYTDIDISWAQRREALESTLVRAEAQELEASKKDKKKKVSSSRKEAKNTLTPPRAPKGSVSTRDLDLSVSDVGEGSADPEVVVPEDWADIMIYDDWSNDAGGSDESLSSLGAASLASSFDQFALFTTDPSRALSLFEKPHGAPDSGLFTYNKKKISHLPDDVIVTIFSYLDFPSFSRIYSVNKRWLDLTKTRSLNQGFFLKTQHEIAARYQIEGAADVERGLNVDTEVATRKLAHSRSNSAVSVPSNAIIAPIASSSSYPGESDSKPPSSRLLAAPESERWKSAPVGGDPRPRSTSNNTVALQPSPSSSSSSTAPLSSPTEAKSDSEVADPPQYRSFQDLLALLTAPDFFNSPSRANVMNDDAFLTMTPSFGGIMMVLLKLIHRFYVEIPPSILHDLEKLEAYTKLSVTPVRRRVVQLMHLLVKLYWPEFTLEERRVIKSFIRVIEKSFGDVLASQVKSAMNAKMEMEARFASLSSFLTAPFPAREKIPDLLVLNSMDIARSLAKIQFDIFRNIRSMELQKQIWTKRAEKAPNVRLMIDRFNAITKWIVSLLVTADKIKLRVKRFTKLVEVAEKLLELRDFHTLMAVLSGLNEGPVYRLKFTLEELPEKAKESYRFLQDIMDAQKSYSKYRESLAASPSFAIPYLGVHLRDLIYFDDAMKNEAGQFNLKTLLGVSTIISQFQEFQNVPPISEINQKTLAYFASLPDSLSMEECATLSKKIEPRGSKREEIQ